MNEMCESLNIVNQSINKISKYNNIKNISLNKDILNNDNFNRQTTILPHLVLNYLNKNNINIKNTKNDYNSMEELINHFKL